MTAAQFTHIRVALMVMIFINGAQLGLLWIIAEEALK